RCLTWINTAQSYDGVGKNLTGQGGNERRADPPEAGERCDQDVIGRPSRALQRFEGASNVAASKAKAPAVKGLALACHNSIELASQGSGAETIKEPHVIFSLTQDSCDFQRSCWLDPLYPWYAKVNDWRIDEQNPAGPYQ